MGRYIGLQRDFTHGELSPLLNTRTDKEIYYKAALKMRNMVVLPQGAVKRRFGLDYVTQFSAPLDKYKAVAFNFSETLSYILIFVPLKILVYENQLLIKQVITPYTDEQVRELDFTQTKNNLFILNKDHPIKFLTRGETDIDWTLADVSFRYLPTWDFRGDYYTAKFSLSSVDVGDARTLTSTEDVFDNDHVGGLFVGYGDLSISVDLGVARITGFTDAKNVTVTVINKFSDEFKTAPGVIGTEVALQEPAWSANRGYPRAATFYAGRFVVAGTRSLPQTIFMSVPNDYYNFDEGTGEPDDSIVAQIANDEIATILHVLGEENLQIFTLSSEYATREIEASFELGDFVMRKQPSSNGSEDIRPINFDNSTIYVKKGGKAIIAFSFTSNNAAYVSTNISIVSAHLIRNPVAMDKRVRSRNDDADFLFIINSDGTLAILQSVIDQKILAWSLADTDGLFKDVIAIGEDIYFFIDRNINGSTVHYIEKLNFDIFLDSEIDFDYITPQKTINGLNHLEGKTVRIKGDGYVLKSKTVVEGSVTLDDEEEAVTHVEVGLDVIPVLETMPLVPPPSPADVSFTEKRLLNIFVEYTDTAGIYVNGINVLTRQLDEKFPYPPLQPQTGNAKIEYAGEWKKRETITITQKDPFPMTLIGIGYEIDIGG